MGSSMTSSDDYAVQNLRLATGHLMAAIGFNSTSNECLDIMTDLMCRFLKKVSAESKFCAEHAGRTQLALSDLTLAFRRMQFNTVEMYDYMKHVNKQPSKHVCKPVPRFPAPRSSSRAVFALQPSETELETRPDHIPAYFPALHPEWTKECAEYSTTADNKPSTSAEKKGTKAAPDFPCFHGMTSRDLSLHFLEKDASAPPFTLRMNDSNATGITSSANVSSRNLTDSPSLSGTAKKKLHNLNRERAYTPSPLPTKTHSPAPPTLTKRDDRPPELIPNRSESKPFKLKLKFDTPTTPQKPKDEGSLSPMPTLEKGETAEYEDLPFTHHIIDKSDSRNGSKPLTPSLAQRPVDNELIASNMELFASLKAEVEREKLKNQQKAEKEQQREKQKEIKRQRKEKKQKEDEIKAKAAIAESERKKAEEEERRRKAVEEDERRKREEQEKRAREEEKRRTEEERRKKEVEAAKKELERLEKEREAIEEAKRDDTKPLKILISKPKSTRPVVSYSPTVVGHVDDDEDTIPFYENDEDDNGSTSFPLNLSLINDSSSKEKKKHKKKDKERDDSRERPKDKKRDKDHKEKKKKRDKDREKDEKNDKDRKDKNLGKSKSEKRKSDSKPDKQETVTPVKIDPELKIPTLKIRLGNQTPSSSDLSPPLVQEAPVKLKFKIPSPDKREERTVPPIQIRMPVASPVAPPSDPKPRDYEVTPEKKKLMTKAELKASPSEFARDAQREKDEKKKRKEEKRKKEEEEKDKDSQRQAEKDREKNVEALRKKQEDQAQQRKTTKKSKTSSSAKPAPVAKIATFDFLGSETKPAPKKEEPVATDEEEVWICPACSVAWTEGADMVACDQCDDWFHWHCVGLLIAPAPDKKWYCQKCELKLKKKTEKRFSTKSDGEPSAKKKKKC